MLLPCCLLEEDTGYSSDAPVHQHERHGALQCQVWRLGSKAVALSHLSVPHMEVLVWWVRVVKLRLLKHMLGCCRFDSPRSVRHMMSAERKGSGDSKQQRRPHSRQQVQSSRDPYRWLRDHSQGRAFQLHHRDHRPRPEERAACHIAGADACRARR